MQGRCLGAIWPILGDLAMFFRCLRYNLRIVTDIAIVRHTPVLMPADWLVGLGETILKTIVVGTSDGALVGV